MSVSQPHVGRVWLEADEVEKYGQLDTSLGLWSECDNVNDHVTAYDGPGLPGTVLPSPLIVFCRGGVVPQIVSSGPDMLIVFRTSPFSVPKVSPFSLNGFELEVDIKFVDKESEVMCQKTASQAPQSVSSPSALWLAKQGRCEVCSMGCQTIPRAHGNSRYLLTILLKNQLEMVKSELLTNLIGTILMFFPCLPFQMVLILSMHLKPFLSS